MSSELDSSSPLPERRIGDRAYDSDGLDADFENLEVDRIAPHHPERKNLTQDGRVRRRCRRRWKVERLFAWMFRFRRLVTHYEQNAGNFLGFVQLACAVILWRRL